MKILILSPRPPYPSKKADAMTVFRLIKYLSEKGHKVDLVCFVEKNDEAQILKQGMAFFCNSIHCVVLSRWRSYLQTLLGVFSSFPLQVSYYKNRKMHRLITDLMRKNQYDNVYTHLIRMAEYSKNLNIPKTLGIQISQALNLGRMVEHNTDLIHNIFYRFEHKKVKPYEANICKYYNYVFLCGQADIDSLNQTTPVHNALICPHGQDIPTINQIQKSEKHPNVIAISGVMSTHTNVEAVTWFVNDIFPIVKSSVPDAEFWIIGRNPSRRIKRLETYHGVKVTGEVDNVYNWLSKATIAVAPVRVAAGMQNKIIQAMACSLPVVSTSIANEGVGAEPGKEIIIADTPDSFANSIISLLKNEKIQSEIGNAARKLVETKWTWEYYFSIQEAVFKEIVKRQ